MDWDESDSIFLNSLPDITDEERHFIEAETLKAGPYAGSLGANKYKLLMSILYKVEKGIYSLYTSREIHPHEEFFINYEKF